MSTIEIICTVAGAAVTVVGSIWAIFTKVFKFGKVIQHLEEFEKQVNGKFDQMQKSMNSIRASIDKFPCADHRDDLTKVKSVLIQNYPLAANLFSAKASPRKLNELGMKLFNDIDGERFIQENKEELFRLIDDSKPLVALDVERAAWMACNALTSTPVFNSIKDYIYNAPSIKLSDGKLYDATLEDACFVLSLRLRDLYLEEKNIG